MHEFGMTCVTCQLEMSRQRHGWTVDCQHVGPWSCQRRVVYTPTTNQHLHINKSHSLMTTRTGSGRQGCRHSLN